MNLTSNSESITHSIQLALAPAFLLTAISSMIGTVCNRLTRLIDRTRALDHQSKNSTHADELLHIKNSLLQLRQRGRLVDACIALLTLSAFLIGLTIMVLFLGKASVLNISFIHIIHIDNNQIALLTFMSAVGFFLLALLGFLYETFISTKMLEGELNRRLEIINNNNNINNINNTNNINNGNNGNNGSINKHKKIKNKKLEK